MREKAVQQHTGVVGGQGGGWTSNHPLVPARKGIKYKKNIANFIAL